MKQQQQMNACLAARPQRRPVLWSPSKGRWRALRSMRGHAACQWWCSPSQKQSGWMDCFLTQGPSVCLKASAALPNPVLPPRWQTRTCRRWPKGQPTRCTSSPIMRLGVLTRSAARPLCRLCLHRPVCHLCLHRPVCHLCLHRPRLWPRRACRLCSHRQAVSHACMLSALSLRWSTRRSPP